MKRTLYLVLLLLTVQVATAQNTTGIIKGTVRTNDGQPAPFVSVLLKNNNRGVVTDPKGEFTFRRLQPGNYTILVTLVGYAPLEQDVRVTGHETATVALQLQVTDTQLKEVIIKGNQQSKKESEYIARLPIKNIENPQVYNVVNKELLKEQVITTFDDALKNAAGVTRLWSSTGRPNDGAGYFTIRGFAVQPKMINGVGGLTNGGVDPANTERIEVIKGPSGTLFGSSFISFGGLINIVTKKPYDTFGGEVTYTAGGFGLNRITADVNTPLDADKKFLFRLNTAYHNEGSFQDAGFKRSFFIAPSLAYQASDRLSFQLNTEIYNAESTNTLMVFLNRGRQLIARTPSELGIDFTRSFTGNDITYKTPTTNLVGQMKYKLSDKWTSQTVAAHSVRKSDGYYSYVMFLDAGKDRLPNDTMLSRFVYTQNQQAIVTNIQQNFTGDFNIGNLRNRVVVGVDFVSQQATNNHSPYALFDTLNATNPKDARYGNLTRPAVDAALSKAPGAKTRNTVTSNTYGAYISNVLNITKALSAMLSIRFDYFDNKGTKNYLTGALTGNYNQTAFSPKFGLNYQVVQDKISFFANYMNGFQNYEAAQPNPALGLDIKYKPQQANQLEGGIKMELLNNKLNATASYYDITVTNMPLQMSAKGGDGITYNYTIQDGTQRSKGIEADVSATPVTGLNIVAGYGYNDSKLTKAADNLKGRRPTSAGPEHVANFWASYTLPGGPMQGLGAGFGGNYTSENLITNDRNTGTFTLPSYTALNATLFYQAKAFRLAVKVDNLANKEYFGGWTTVERQMPRRLSASAAFRF